MYGIYRGAVILLAAAGYLGWYAAVRARLLRPRRTPPEQLCRTLERLGTTFVKLGQILSTRVDQFEPEWIAEFSQLQDHAPPCAWEQVHAQLCEDLGAPPETLFAHFDPTPLAAGSIAQVHRARLDDGCEVVVKVRRPGIQPLIEADLRWLARLAEMAEADSPELRAFRPREMVRQFSRSLHRELDLANEGRQSDRIAANFRTWRDAEAPPDSTEPVIAIPRIHWLWTSERVCVQDRVQGIAGRQLDAVDAAGLDRKLLARRGARAVLKMIVADGLFHADPHAGNVFYLPGNRIAFIDFGMVGQLSKRRREELLSLLLGLVERRPQPVADVLFDWTGDHRGVDLAQLEDEIEAFVSQYHGTPLAQLNLGQMLADVTHVLREHRLALPGDLALLIKAFVSLESMGRGLDPDFHMAAEAQPILRATLRARYQPRALAQRGWEAALHTAGSLARLPQDLSTLLRRARHGKVQVGIEIADLRRTGNQIDRAASRLALALVIAALIIGSSIVMTVEGGPTLLGLPAFGLLGFVGAVVGGLLLVRSVWRGRRSPRDDGD
jgi:ubiquinone biosynthesis protein